MRRERGEAGGQPISRGTVCSYKRRGRHPLIALLHEYLQHEDNMASRACDFIATAHDTVPAYGNTH